MGRFGVGAGTGLATRTGYQHQPSLARGHVARGCGSPVLTPRCSRRHPGLVAVALGMPKLANRPKEIMMAGLLNRIKNMLRSPKGQQMTNKAREMAKDPRNRERARQAAQKLRRRR